MADIGALKIEIDGNAIKRAIDETIKRLIDRLFVPPSVFEQLTRETARAEAAMVEFGREARTAAVALAAFGAALPVGTTLGDGDGETWAIEKVSGAEFGVDWGTPPDAARVLGTWDVERREAADMANDGWPGGDLTLAKDCRCRRDAGTQALILEPTCPAHGRAARGLSRDLFGVPDRPVTVTDVRLADDDRMLRDAAGREAEREALVARAWASDEGALRARIRALDDAVRTEALSPLDRRRVLAERDAAMEVLRMKLGSRMSDEAIIQAIGEGAIPATAGWKILRERIARRESTVSVKPPKLYDVTRGTNLYVYGNWGNAPDPWMDPGEPPAVREAQAPRDDEVVVEIEPYRRPRRRITVEDV